MHKDQMRAHTHTQ